MDRVELFTSAVLLAELEDFLHREKFAQRLTQIDLAPRDLVLGYAALATVVEPAAIDPVVLDDPDDDAVLAGAVAIGAEVIVSGDSHLLDLEDYQGIPILKIPGPGGKRVQDVQGQDQGRPLGPNFRSLLRGSCQVFK